MKKTCVFIRAVSLDFYRELGFVAASASYDEDGIPHREMMRPGP